MDKTEPFLKRWSRRKQAMERHASPAEAAPAPEDVTPAPTADGEGKPDAPDIAALPPIETIAADTDIRAFLAKGVPAELRQAALRQAWSTDPAIRDFVGMADYDWDFNAPGAKLGFGPLEAGAELRRQVARILGEGTKDHGVAPAPTTDVPSATPATADDSNETPPLDAAATSNSDVHHAPAPKMIVENPKVEHAAVQQHSHSPAAIPLTPRKSHGRALPDSS